METAHISSLSGERSCDTCSASWCSAMDAVMARCGTGGGGVIVIAEAALLDAAAATVAADARR